MADDAHVPISAAHVLATFFDSAPVAGHPSIRARLPRVRDHLLTFLDTEAERWLTADELVLVCAERELEPVDAVIRVAGAELLVAALPAFCRPEWLLPARLAARAPLHVVAAVGPWALERGYLPGPQGRMLLERIDLAVARARARLGGRAQDRPIWGR